jgi:hypothetical protein
VKNQNPLIDEFLRLYSQSEKSTRGTRGYDEKTYVETKLDAKLIPTIFAQKTKLVILSGNAGDGKTAFIQRVEAYAQANGAQCFSRTDNGCTFTLNDIPYETLYDGSQDFEGATNDSVLATFFKDFEGNSPPTDHFTKIIAINEGKLRDFLLGKSQYKWLSEQVRRHLASEGSNADDPLIFVNLNSRGSPLFSVDSFVRRVERS